MKRKSALFLVLCLAVTSFTACSGSSGGKDHRSSRVKNPGIKTEGTGTAVETVETVETSTTSGTDPTSTPAPAEQVVNFSPNANANINWVTYTSNDGFYTIEAPAGWTITSFNYDTIGYEVYARDPSGEKKFYFSTSIVGYPSEENFEYWMSAGAEYGFPTYEHGYISPEATPESFFENSGDFFGYTDFEVVENMGPNGYGGDILKAYANYGGRAYEGIYTSSLIDTPLYYQEMDWDLITGTMVIALPVEDFTDWIDIMFHIYSTLEFTDAYYSARRTAWQLTFQTSDTIMFNANATSAMIMDSWEYSNHTSDITSQEYSDATLGRERILDTETGDIYYASNGWSDSYYGSRYEPLTPGSDYYLQPVVGTIY